MREREQTEKIVPSVPYRQICENCQQPFYYHYPVHYCPECEDMIYGEEKYIYGNHNDPEMLEIERMRSKNTKKNNYVPHSNVRGHYIVEYDPLPNEEGGMNGAMLNKEDVIAIVNMKSIDPGAILRFEKKNSISRYRVVCVGKTQKYKLEKITEEKR